MEAWLAERGITTLHGVVTACRSMGATLPAVTAAMFDRLLHTRVELPDPKNQENLTGDSTIVVSKDSAPKPGLVTLASGRTRRRPKDDHVVVDIAPPQFDPPRVQANDAKTEPTPTWSVAVDGYDESRRAVGLVACDDATGVQVHAGSPDVAAA